MVIKDEVDGPVSIVVVADSSPHDDRHSNASSDEDGEENNTERSHPTKEEEQSPPGSRHSSASPSRRRQRRSGSPSRKDGETSDSPRGDRSKSPRSDRRRRHSGSTSPARGAERRRRSRSGSREERRRSRSQSPRDRRRREREQSRREDSRDRGRDNRDERRGDRRGPRKELWTSRLREDRRRRRSDSREEQRRSGRWPQEDKSRPDGRRHYRDLDRPGESDNEEEVERRAARRREDTIKRREEEDKFFPKKDSDEKKSGDSVVAKKKPDDPLLMKSGGAYIPPAKLRAMQANITDKSSVQYQRLSWETLKKSLHGLVNKVNTSNVGIVVKELLKENIVRGRGLLARSIITSAVASQTYANVHAGLVSVVNSQFPQIGELILKRLISSFKKGYKRNDKSITLGATKFIAHLVNQQVAHEILALEILMLLLENPTDDSIEVAIAFIKECGAKLKEVSHRGLMAIVDRLRSTLHEAKIEARTQYMIEVAFAVIKDNFADYPAVVPDLDLVDEADQYTHLLSLEDPVDEERVLDVFKEDPDFVNNESKYEQIKREVLGEGSDGESGEGDESSADEEEDGPDGPRDPIIDKTETNMLIFRRTVYLTIQSALNFEEAAHKLMKMDMKPGQEYEFCSMILDCCAQLRTYERFYGLLAERFCRINSMYAEQFEAIFKEQYETCHRLEMMKLRNVAKFYAHLLYTNGISWGVLQCISMNEDDTSSSGRIFVKILFQELAEYTGMVKLNEHLTDPTLAHYFVGIFPTDHPKKTRFSINFFTSIGLGGLTDGLREQLAAAAKKRKLEEMAEELAALDSSSGSGSGSDSDSSSDSE